jgi:hypothetical protein
MLAAPAGYFGYQLRRKRFLALKPYAALCRAEALQLLSENGRRLTAGKLYRQFMFAVNRRRGLRSAAGWIWRKIRCPLSI